MRSRRDVKVPMKDNDVVRHQIFVKCPHPCDWLTVLNLNPLILVNAISPACSVTALVPTCAFDMIVFAAPFNIINVADPKSFVVVLLDISPARRVWIMLR